MQDVYDKLLDYQKPHLNNIINILNIKEDLIYQILEQAKHIVMLLLQFY